MKLLFTLSFLFSAVTFAQTITIVDAASKKPIQGVFVSSNAYPEGVLSNEKGKVDLSSFENTEWLKFIHTSHETAYVQKQTIDLNVPFNLTVKDNLLPELYVNHPLRYFLVEDDEAAQIQTISRNVVKLENPATSADMLQNTGNILVQKSQGGGGSPIIRGFEANKLLLVVDGIRMNNAIYRSGHLQNSITIDNAVLDQTEIIFGPSSSLYGSDALGGVIHFKTIDPFVPLKDSSYFNGSTYVRYNSNNSISGNFNFSTGRNKWASLTSFTASRFNDFKMGTNRLHGEEEWGLHAFYSDQINGQDSMIVNTDPTLQIGSGYTQFDFLEKFVYQASDQLKMTFNFQYSTSSNIDRYDKLTEYRDGKLRFSEWYYGPQNRLLGALKFDFNSKSKFFKNGVATLSYQRIDEDRIERKFQSEWREFQEEDLSIVGLNLDFNKVFTKSRILFYGLEVQQNFVTSTAFEQNINSSERNVTQTRYPFDSQYLNSGIYLDFKQKFTNKNVFTTGIRYSFIHAHSQFDDTSFVQLPFNEVNISTGAPSGHLGFVMNPDEKTKIKTLLSTGFRAPNIDDYGKVFEKSGVTVVPNNQVKPEYAFGGEFSFDRTFGKECLTIGGAVFGTYLFDALVQQDFTLNGEDSIFYNDENTKIQAIVNTNTALVYGVNAYLILNIAQHLNAQATYNYTKGTDLTNSVPLEHIAPQFGKIAVNYQTEKLNSSLFSFYNFRKRRADYRDGGDNIDLTPHGEGTPPWWTLNYRISYTFANVITAQFSVENIFNVHYRQFSSGISAPGRNFMVGLRATF